MSIAALFYRGILWKGLLFLSAFILNIMIARHFTATSSGQLYYLINVYTFVILVVGLSLESSMGYYVSSNEIGVGKMLTFSVAWIIIAGAGILFFMNAGKGFFHNDSRLFAISFICGNILSSYCAGIAYAKKNFVLPNIINASVNIGLILLLAGMAFTHPAIISDEVFLTIFFVSFLLQAIIAGIALAIIYSGKRELVFPSGPDLNKLFRFGIFAFAGNLITFLLYRVDYWFVQIYCSPADLGNYIQVSKLAQVFFVLPGVLAGIVFPLTAGGQRQYINDMLATLSRLIFMFYIGCCLILGLAGYWLFPFVFGYTFTNMYIPFLLLIPGILALSTLYTLTAYYAGKNRLSVNIKGALAGLAYMIVADLLFVPKFGINAAALNSSIAYIIYHIYVLAVFTNEYGSTAISFFNFKLSDVQKIRRSISTK